MNEKNIEEALISYTLYLNIDVVIKLILIYFHHDKLKEKEENHSNLK